MGDAAPTAQPPEWRLGRRPVLDGVRAVAILAVLAVHFGSGPKLDWPSGGFLGVDIFFVLSGFLITSILLEERARTGSFSFRAFYVRRALRLFPALVLVVLAFLVYTVTFAPAALVRDNLIAAGATLTYWTNWLYAGGLFEIGQTGLMHAWTLSIEEQFYVLWPLVLATALALGRRRAALLTTLAGIGVVVLWRLVQVGPAGEDFGRLYFGFDTRADSLLVGCLLALLLLDPRWLAGGRSAALRILLVPSMLLVGVSLVFAREEWPVFYVGGFTLFAVATAVVLYNLVTWRPPVLSALLESGPMVYVGRISYGLYLWHWPIYLALRDELARGWLTALVGVTLTFLLAAASFRYVEQPFLRFKKRFERRSVPTPEDAPGSAPAPAVPAPRRPRVRTAPARSSLGPVGEA